MSANSFRAFGVLTLLMDVGLIGVIIQEALSTTGLDAQFRVRIPIICVSTTAVGIGLLCLRKWAAIYFSLASFSHGTWLILSSIETIPFPGNLLYVCLGITLLLPALVTIRVWSQLSWGGRWFFWRAGPMRLTHIRIAVGLCAFILGVSAHSLWARFQWHPTTSAVAQTLSIDEKWHRLYEAAGMTGSPKVIGEVGDRLLCTNREGVPDALPIEIDGQSWCRKADTTIHEVGLHESSEYGSFCARITDSHRSWTLQNLDFARSISTAKSARAYVLSHQWPPNR